jgi:hypothetical protein
MPDKQHPTSSLAIFPQTLPKSRRKRIPYNQLLPLPKTRPKIPHALIQRRTKHIAHVAEHTLMLLDTQPLAQEPYYRCKSLVRGQFEDALR